MNIKRKILGKLIVRDLRKTDVMPFRIARLKEEFLNDYFYNKDTTKEQKKWAYKRGFVSEKIDKYGLTEENYKDYMPDVEFYYRKNYKNIKFTHWFDDKATTWYMLAPFKKNLPKHYFIIENHNITAFDELDNNPNKTVDDVIFVLKEKKALALKATHGGHGEGFYKISYDGKNFKANDDIKDEEGMKQLLSKINGYIVTEFVKPCKELDGICNGVTPAVRVVVVNDKDIGPVMTSAIIRYGADPTSIVTGFDETIYAGIDIDTGELFKPMIRVGPEEYFYLKDCEKHPVTGCEIKGSVPNWTDIKEVLYKVGRYLSPTPYLTFDLVPTDDGVKILEINSHGQLGVSQPFHPFFKNEYNRKLFGKE